MKVQASPLAGNLQGMFLGGVGSMKFVTYANLSRYDKEVNQDHRYMQF